MYGERLLGNLSVIEDDEAATPGESRPFADLVQGQDSYEVARSFSALLQLVCSNFHATSTLSPHVMLVFLF